mmetsp:Transcript_46929/g.134181  ORF Transcript_46929/g.134181 Transcript_46929/m.134181 type:complete len:224 (+) Transcript_46929:1439-2110(+)
MACVCQACTSPLTFLRCSRSIEASRCRSASRDSNSKSLAITETSHQPSSSVSFGAAQPLSTEALRRMRRISAQVSARGDAARWAAGLPGAGPGNLAGEASAKPAATCTDESTVAEGGGGSPATTTMTAGPAAAEAEEPPEADRSSREPDFCRFNSSRDSCNFRLGSAVEHAEMAEAAQSCGDRLGASAEALDETEDVTGEGAGDACAKAASSEAAHTREMEIG